MIQALLALLVVFASHASGEQARSQVLWDHWYAVTGPGSVPYAIYNEKVTSGAGRVNVQNQLWKREEGQITEENLGAVAEDTRDMQPKYFHFRSAYRSKSVELDGTFSMDSGAPALTVKGRSGGHPVTVPVRRGLKGVFLSSFFPVWLSKRMGALKPKQTLSFRVVFEDDLSAGFSPVSGHLWIEEPTSEERDEKLQRVRLQYRGSKSVWWIRPDGAAERIENVEQGSRVRRVTREEAERFIGLVK
ncbi:MAG: hypothetical protein IT285_10085 [Bdellovibrionales bacterium]|nr:hypothetical protein [Bdellovibrionales bacterium]